jgi:hypothetical protein
LKGCDVLKSALLPLFLHLSVLSELWLLYFQPRIDTLEKLALALTEHEGQLIFDKSLPVKGGTSDPYNRHALYAGDISGAFNNFYKFVFSLAKTQWDYYAFVCILVLSCAVKKET